MNDRKKASMGCYAAELAPIWVSCPQFIPVKFRQNPLSAEQNFSSHAVRDGEGLGWGVC